MIKLNPWMIESESTEGSLRVVTFNEFQMNYKGEFVPFDILSLYDVGQIILERGPSLMTGTYTAVVKLDRSDRKIYLETDQNKLKKNFGY